MLKQFGLIQLVLISLLGCGKDSADSSLSTPVSSETSLTGTISGNPAEIFSVSLLINGSIVQDRLTTVEIDQGDLVNCQVESSLVSGGQLRKNLIVIPKNSSLSPVSLDIPEGGIAADQIFTSLPAFAHCYAEIQLNGVTLTSRSGDQRMLRPSQVGFGQNRFNGFPPRGRQ